MARYRGPIFRKARMYNTSLLETGKEFAKGKQRTITPGQKGTRRNKLSDYGTHLYEKQKLRYIYGVNERQFYRLFLIARKSRSVTGLTFLRILESRLDNVVYRSGMAQTRRQARQLVSHAHFTVNGKKVNIPSYLVKIGDEIELKPKAQSLKVITESMATRKPAAWMTVRDSKIKIDRLPERNEINSEINEALVVEYY